MSEAVSEKWQQENILSILELITLWWGFGYVQLCDDTLQITDCISFLLLRLDT